MANTALIGVIAGLCAALLFAASATGPVPLRAALILVSALPIAVAGLGWGWTTAVVATIAGAVSLGVSATPTFALAFAVTQALPQVVLAHRAGLSRVIAVPSTPGGSDYAGAAVEWYPPGRLVLWAAGMSAVLGGAVLLLLGPDLETLRAAVRGFVETFVKSQLNDVAGAGPVGERELAEMTDIALVLLPAAMAISAMGAMLVNLWLGGHVARAAGRLRRPWPDLATLTYPPGTPALLAIATAATFLSGYPGLAASAVFGSLYLAYVLLGLAVIHSVTRGHPWRSFALWGIYGGLVVFNTVASLLIAVLGLADTIRPMRQPQSASPPPTGPPRRPDEDGPA